MTKMLAWQDKNARRRMFDGIQWFDVDPGETVIVLIGRDLDTRLLAALGVTSEPDKPEATE